MNEDTENIDDLALEDGEPFEGFEDEDDLDEGDEEIEERIAPLFNYDFMNVVVDPVGRVENGNELDAYRFWVTKCLLTERYKYLAYDTDFGVEFEEIIRSNPDRDIAESEIIHEIEEALGVDERTISVEDFEFEWDGSRVHVTFAIESVFGESQVELEMDGDNVDEGRVSIA